MTLYSLSSVFLPANEMQMASIINVFIMQIDIFKNNQTELTTTINQIPLAFDFTWKAYVCNIFFFLRNSILNASL